jgi:RHS repeat-associated protein
VTDPLSHVTTYGYDAADNRVSVEDAGGNVTGFGFDVLNRATTETDPLGKVTTAAYDAAGRVESVTDRLGRVRVFGYDAAGRKTTETWEDAGGATVRTQTFGYDGNGNLTAATDPGGSYAIDYDVLDRPIEVDEPFGVGLTFGYDGAGNRTTVTDSQGGVVTSVFDLANRLTSRQLDGPSADARVDSAYTPLGAVDTLTRYADLAGTTLVGTTEYDYDAGGRVTGVTTKDDAGVTLLATGYGYDLADRLTSRTEGGVTTVYTYDAAGQLTGDGATTFGYDATGNRTGAVVGAGNRVLSDGTWAYTYDDEGQLVKKSQGALADTWTYAYDHEGRLTGATRAATDGGSATATVAYTYDALGNRASRTAWDGTTTVTERFAYDGWDPAKPGAVGTEGFDAWAEVDGSGVVTTRRAFGAGFDEPVAVVTGGTAGWYAADLVGSVRLTVDAAGAPTSSATYDAFGNLVSGTRGDRYGYAGREWDGVLGQSYNRARVYDPAAGRWWAEDPLGLAAGDVNLYRYVGNQPTTRTDPSGMQYSSGGSSGSSNANGGMMGRPYYGSGGTGAGGGGGMMRPFPSSGGSNRDGFGGLGAGGPVYQPRPPQPVGTYPPTPPSGGSTGAAISGWFNQLLFGQAMTPSRPRPSLSDTAAAAPGSLPQHAAQQANQAAQQVGAALGWVLGTTVYQEWLPVYNAYQPGQIIGFMYYPYRPYGSQYDPYHDSHRFLMNFMMSAATAGAAEGSGLMSGGFATRPSRPACPVPKPAQQTGMGGGVGSRAALANVVDPHLDANILIALSDPANVNHAAALKFVTDNQAAGLSASVQSIREMLAKPGIAPDERLTDILTIATRAVLAGADGWEKVVDSGGAKRRSSAGSSLPPPVPTLANGIPNHDTFYRAFARLDPDAFADQFGRWMVAACEAAGLVHVTVDGESV